MPDVTDLFPLDPVWPIGRPLQSRKMREEMDSGKIYVRSEGTDLRVFNLAGQCSVADYESFLTFYEAHAVCGCTLHDESYSPAQDWQVMFTAPPDFEESTYDTVVWSCTLRQTTTA
jgi:hypothetical protein